VYTTISKVVLCLFLGDDISRATKEITNASVVSKVIVFSNMVKDMTDRHGWAHKMFFA
jgi:hypothetical protein